MIKNGLSVGFPGCEKSMVTPCPYAHLPRLFEINSLPLPGMNCQTFLTKIIHYSQCPETPSDNQTIRHEIHT